MFAEYEENLENLGATPYGVAKISVNFDRLESGPVLRQIWAACEENNRIVSGKFQSEAIALRQEIDQQRRLIDAQRDTIEQQAAKTLDEWSRIGQARKEFEDEQRKAEEYSAGQEKIKEDLRNTVEQLRSDYEQLLHARDVDRIVEHMREEISKRDKQIARYEEQRSTWTFTDSALRSTIAKFETDERKIRENERRLCIEKIRAMRPGSRLTPTVALTLAADLLERQ